MEVSLSPSYNSSYNVTFLDDFSRNMSSSLDPPLYVYIYVSVINILIFFVGVIGNALVIQVVVRVRAMRKRMNYFLVSLSAADLLVLLIGLPAALHEFYGKEKWFIGEVMCKLVPFLENASHHCSVLTLLAIGFERYYAICHPLRQTVGSRLASTAILIPAVWLFSCVVSVPFAITSRIKVSRYYDNSLVETCRTDTSSILFRAYIIFISIAFLAIPLLLLTVLYSAIIRTLQSSTVATAECNGSAPDTSGRQGQNKSNMRNARAMASRRQVVRMMVGVMVLYFVCLVPLRCVQLWLVFGSQEDLVSLGFVGYLNLLNCVRILVYVNSAGNPVIYGLLSSNFRAAFKQSLSRCRARPTENGRQATYCSNVHNYPDQLHLEHPTQLSHIGADVNDKLKKENKYSANTKSFSGSKSPRPRSRSNSQNSLDRGSTPLVNNATIVKVKEVKPGLAYV